MIDAQNKCLSITDVDVQPMEKVGIQVVESVLVGVAFQRGDVAAITGRCGLHCHGKWKLLDFCHVPFPAFRFHDFILSSVVSHNPGHLLTERKG